MVLTQGCDCDDFGADVINTNENDNDCDGINTEIDCDDSSADVPVLNRK